MTSGNKTVAVHPRLGGKYEKSIRFEHYVRVLDELGYLVLNGNGIKLLFSVFSVQAMRPKWPWTQIKVFIPDKARVS